MSKTKTDLKILNQVSDAHSYAEGFNGLMTKYRAQRFFSLLGKDAKTQWKIGLELGAGEGSFTKTVCSNFEHFYAVEAAKIYFDKLVQQTSTNKNVTTKNELIEDFTTAESCDVIFLIGVLEHVHSPVDILQKCKNILKPGGYLYATVPNAQSLHRRLGLKMGAINSLTELGELDHKVGHLRYYTSDSLISDFKNAGFQDLSCSGTLVKPLDNLKMESLPAALIDGLFSLGPDLPELCAEIAVLAKA